MERIVLYNDSFQNWKSHDITKAQLILTDIPYQLGENAYGSSPEWYKGGTIRMANLTKRKNLFLTPTQRPALEFLNSFTFVLRCLKKSQKKRTRRDA